MTARRGFALLAVLWVLSLSSVLALDATLVARDDVAASSNRSDRLAAEWRASDCLERARSTIDASLADARRRDAVATVWRSLDHLPREADSGCSVSLVAAGARLDVNSADERQLRALFHAMGVPDPTGLADKLLDWRDIDDDPREHGAEYQWYLSQRRRAPRNGPLADLAELARVAGFEELAQFDSVLAVEPGRIPINSAPVTVLASLPGMTREVLSRVAMERDAGRQITDLLALAGSVSRGSADSIRAHFPELAQLTTVNPEAWILIARGEAGMPAIVVELEARLMLGDGRALISRMRSR